MTETLYIASATSLLEKIARYEAIILALEGQALISAGDSDIEEYALDDGQIKIRTLFRDPMAIADAILKFIKLKNKCLNDLNGKVMIGKSRRGLS